MPNLIPCPFCACARVEIRAAGPKTAYAVCLGCGACSKVCAWHQVVEAWNRRASV